MTFFRREHPQPKKQGKDFQVLPARLMSYRFRHEIEIFLSEVAGDVIREHPKCPFYEFAALKNLSLSDTVRLDEVFD